MPMRHEYDWTLCRLRAYFQKSGGKDSILFLTHKLSKPVSVVLLPLLTYSSVNVPTFLHKKAYNVFVFLSLGNLKRNDISKYHIRGFGITKLFSFIWCLIKYHSMRTKFFPINHLGWRSLISKSQRKMNAMLFNFCL